MRKGYQTCNDISIWISLLEEYGFPIIITVYLLLRFEKKLSRPAIALDEMEETVRHNAK
ncbi:YvrJ family protein [Lentibacillus salicampi]|uniref:YvrJ family protein n=1 Tax=Lentibacillus salicampi TaxID=175306 RepID=A0A4Y9AAT8_9BACI|nr:YvrJ family protein [Lentibacillus salicampi]